MSEPLSTASQGVAWVMCHSFGREQVDLHMTDVSVARQLAAAGYPVVRFHCLGYGDASDVETSAGPASHVRDTIAVVEHLSQVAGVGRVGVVGSRFGGTIAALVADALGLPFLVAIAPVLSGSRYMDELLRSRAIAQMLDEGGLDGQSGGDGVRSEFDTKGMVNVKGLGLRREIFEEMNALNLPAAMSRFAGNALIVQVTRRDAPQKALASFVGQLQSLGASARLQVVTDPFAHHFANEHLQLVAKGTWGDSLVGVNEALGRAMIDWISGIELSDHVQSELR